MKGVDVDETFVLSSVAGKSISHEEKLILLDEQPCQSSKVVLLKRKKKIGKWDRCCYEGLFRRCCYDVITTHLEYVENGDRKMEVKKKGIKKGEKIHRSKLRLMSKINSLI